MTSSNEKTTILYVEDNLENRVLVRRILMSENYAVLEAVNAEQALALSRQAPQKNGVTQSARGSAAPAASPPSSAT